MNTETVRLFLLRLRVGRKIAEIAGAKAGEGPQSSSFTLVVGLHLRFDDCRLMTCRHPGMDWEAPLRLPSTPTGSYKSTSLHLSCHFALSMRPPHIEIRLSLLLLPSAFFAAVD